MCFIEHEIYKSPFYVMESLVQSQSWAGIGAGEG